MDKISTAANACAYGASCGTGSYWLYQLTTKLTPDQWAAIGVMGSLAFAFLTYVTNAAIKVWAIKRGYKLPEGED